MDEHHRRGRRVTSVDVAKAAGVSQTAVSLVFTGRAEGRLSSKTRQHIEDTAAMLGYVPDASARVLRGGAPRVIGLAVPDMRNEYFNSVYLGVEAVARGNGMAVVLVDTGQDPGWVARMIEMNRTRLFAGAIVYAETSAVAATLTSAVEHCVFVEGPETDGSTVIDIDIAGAMREVAQHLRGLGHARIGHARADYPRETFELRAHHLAAELAHLGCSPEPAWHYRSGFDCDESTRRAREFLESVDVTAIVCDDDLLAAGVYRACAQLGRSIPDELSVVGFNDTVLARYLAPELTSVAIPGPQVGEQAALALIDGVNGAAATKGTLPLSLESRASTAPPTAVSS
jgi:LacI family transcriptional regulator/LacI family repressor for deo operon, udp, cdd, tsx, nupC, and nupG